MRCFFFVSGPQMFSLNIPLRTTSKMPLEEIKGIVNCKFYIHIFNAGLFFLSYGILNIMFRIFLPFSNNN